jgi:hypothetical protein
VQLRRAVRPSLYFLHQINFLAILHNLQGLRGFLGFFGDLVLSFRVLYRGHLEQFALPPPLS